MGLLICTAAAPTSGGRSQEPGPQSGPGPLDNPGPASGHELPDAGRQAQTEREPRPRDRKDQHANGPHRRCRQGRTDPIPHRRALSVRQNQAGQVAVNI